MRQAITTKYLPLTNHKYARIKAKAYAGSITIEWDDELGIYANHAKAAQKLFEKLGWDSNAIIVGGTLPNGDCVYVIIDKPLK